MHIKRARLRNWCQHEDLVLEYAAGLNAVTGANRKGKSNTYDGIRFAITGKSVNHGNKADNLRFGEKTGWVELEFAVGDTDYVLRRSIESAKVRLKFGKTELSKADEVEQELTRVFGTSMKTLLNSVFIPQAQIDAVLNSKDSDRLSEFEQTFGLDRAAKAHEALAREANAYELTPGLEDKLRQATELVGEAQAVLSMRTKAIDDLKRQIVALEPAEKKIRDYQEAIRVQHAIRQAEEQIQAAEADLKTQTTELQRLKAEYDQHQHLLAQMAPHVEQARKMIQDIDAAQAAWERAQGARTELSRLQAELAKLPVRPAAEVEAMRQELATAYANRQRLGDLLRNPASRPRTTEETKLEADHQEAVAELRQVELTKPAATPEMLKLEPELRAIEREMSAFADGTCPTCGQPVHGGPEEAAKRQARFVQLSQAFLKLEGEMIGAHQGRVTALRAKAAGLKLQIEEYRKVGTEMLKSGLKAAEDGETAIRFALDVAEKQRTAHDAVARQIDTAAAVLVASPQAAPDLAERERAKLFYVEHERLAAKSQEAQVQYRIAEGSVRGGEARLAQMREGRKKLGDAMQLPNEAEMKAAYEQAASLSERRADLTAELEAIGMHRGLMSQREAEANRLRDQYNRESHAMAWVEEVKKARDVLHRTALPALTMREFGRIINDRLQYYLDVWERPFQMWLDDQMRFQVKWPTGVQLPAGRLSGAEKIIGSLCFHLAMSDTFARDVGLLMLDEPSERMDESNLQLLPRLLLKLKELSAHSGRQILVITHHKSLLGFFDHTIEIK